MVGIGKLIIIIIMVRKLVKIGFVIGSFFFWRGVGDCLRVSKFVLIIVC